MIALLTVLPYTIYHIAIAFIDSHSSYFFINTLSLLTMFYQNCRISNAYALLSEL